VICSYASIIFAFFLTVSRLVIIGGKYNCVLNFLSLPGKCGTVLVSYARIESPHRQHHKGGYAFLFSLLHYAFDFILFYFLVGHGILCDPFGCLHATSLSNRDFRIRKKFDKRKRICNFELETNEREHDHRVKSHKKSNMHDSMIKSIPRLSSLNNCF